MSSASIIECIIGRSAPPSQAEMCPSHTASGAVIPVSSLTTGKVFAILCRRYAREVQDALATRRRYTMNVVRIYTGADNQTHFQDVDVDTFATLSARIGEGQVRVNQGPARSNLDFHNAPRRQYVVVMSGVMEIEIGDGSKRQFVP